MLSLQGILEIKTYKLVESNKWKSYIMQAVF